MGMAHRRAGKHEWMGGPRVGSPTWAPSAEDKVTVLKTPSLH